MHTAEHGNIDQDFGSNPFFFVNEPGQGYVTVSSTGKPPTDPTWPTGYLPPNDEQANTRGAEGPHNGGVYAVMCDGHVVWVRNEVTPTVYFAAFTRNAGDLPGGTDF
jgi:prepilin-type processing-associated H-X9-DG protein